MPGKRPTSTAFLTDGTFHRLLKILVYFCFQIFFVSSVNLAPYNKVLKHNTGGIQSQNDKIKLKI